jgi:hypothetical protein
MKRKLFLVVTLLLMAGIFSISAQDLIIFRDGSMMEAQVTEISPTEIRYRRIDHLDGPVVAIPVSNVLSIRYQNGRVEIFDTVPSAGQARPPEAAARSTQPSRSENTAIDPNKFIFGVNTNPAGFVNYIWNGSSGPSVGFEFGRGNFNSEINLMFPFSGFGALVTFNRFWHSQLGGAYFGGGVGFAFYDTWGETEVWVEDRRWISWGGNSGYWHDDSRWVYNWERYTAVSLPVGLNAGYKIVTRSGVYFRTGGFVGFDIGSFFNEVFTLPVYIKPDLAIGWTMR